MTAILRRRMRRSVRQLFSLVVCVAVMLAGSGFANAYADAIEHVTGNEASAGSLDSPPAGGGERTAVCEHGCASHVGGHLLSIPTAAVFLIQVTRKPVLASAGHFRAIAALASPFFRPPRILLG